MKACLRRNFHVHLLQQIRIFTFIAVFMASGLAAVVVQTLAWANMLPAQLLQTGSITEAVENTFDGKHACRFCDAAEALRKSQMQSEQEDQAPPLSPAKSFLKDLTDRSSDNIFVPSGTRLFLSLVRENKQFVKSRSEAPSTPPPDFC